MSAPIRNGRAKEFSEGTLFETTRPETKTKLGISSGLRRKNMAKWYKGLSVSSSVGSPLCPYGIAYCRVCELSVYFLSKKLPNISDYDRIVQETQ